MAAVKFCGLQRPEDAAAAVRFGADYVGVIFAGGPRQVTIHDARRVLEPTRGTARAVGVFGDAAPEAIARIVDEAGLDIVQLSADPDVDTIEALRLATEAEVWATVRCGSVLPPGIAALFAHSDAVHLDARVEGVLGGTGQTLPWELIAPALRAARGERGRLVLSGGLRPENVRAAIRAMEPDIVDVSSGVELAPGIKDHERMRAFTNEVR